MQERHLKHVTRDQNVIFGMTLGAGGAVVLVVFFGVFTAILWFTAISIVGLLFTLYSAGVE